MNIEELLSSIAEAKAILLMEIDELEAALEAKKDQLSQLDPDWNYKSPAALIKTTPESLGAPARAVYEAAEAARPKDTYPVCPSCDGRMVPTLQTLGNGKTYNALVCLECNNEKVA